MQDQLDTMQNLNENTNDQLSTITTKIQNMSVSSLDSKRYTSVPLKPSMEEILVLIKVKFTLSDSRHLRIFLVNRCQKRNYHQSRTDVIKRLIRRKDIKYTGPIHIEPLLILVSANSVSLWNQVRVTYSRYFETEGSQIILRTPIWKIGDLLTAMRDEFHITIKPIDELKKEYEELLQPIEEEDIELDIRT